MEYYGREIKQIEKEFSTNLKTGLTLKEAKKRIDENGLNKLVEAPKDSFFKLFLLQFHDWLIYVLLAATVLTFVVQDYISGIVILAIVIVNAVIGVIQEEKANKAIAELKKMSSPKSLIKRDGKLIEIDSSFLVVGDIVLLSAGRFVPADLRLISSSSLQIDESSLTGESVPAEKDASLVYLKEKMPLGDQKNMAFSSTFVTYGKGEGVVVKTAMATEIGKIATILDAEDKQITPLQKRLEALGKTIGIVIIVICGLLFLISFIQYQPWIFGFNLKDIENMFITAVSLAVAAIPEGIVAIVTVVLAIGSSRLTKRNAIVKKLPAMETLGSVNVICSDKTGTLTYNKMKVIKSYTSGKTTTLSQSHQLNSDEKKMVEAFVLCSDATYSVENSTGDPTEIALVQMGYDYGLLQAKMNKDKPRIDELPFDSTRKRMSTYHQGKDGYYVYTKGALDFILNISTHYLKDGEIVSLTEKAKQEIIAQADKMSLEALRVLAVSYKRTENKVLAKDFEKDLIFMGFVGLMDPPREEVKEAINSCKKAGIKVVMITGDHKNTAYAIGKELGIISNLKESLTGLELDLLSEKELVNKIDDINVFARVSPEHKVRIVKALQQKGHIVSMTGDGVNDAPSLKVADIGVSMGITGTDVTKQASDMILTDDNFSTIVNAIEEGRNIYNNIKKSILYLLSCNLGEVISIALAIFLGWPAPLLALQILWVNLVNDAMPAIGLGMDTYDKDVMNEKPRPQKESFFANKAWLRAIITGLTVATVTLLAFIIGMNEKGVGISQIHLVKQATEEFIHASTMAFIVLATTQLFFAFSIRNQEKSVFQIGVFKNKMLIVALFVGIILQLLVIYIPFLQTPFGVEILNLKDWLIVVLFSLVPFLVDELYKLLIRLKKKRNLTKTTNS